MLIFGGDIHGNWKYLISLIKRKRIENSSIILCGDLGLGFKGNESKEYKELIHWSAPLEKANVDIYGLRGNHDDPYYFDGRTHGRITLVKDYSTLLIEGKNILFIGGAVSLDRSQRTIGRTWWLDEVIAPMPSDLCDYEGIDIVATHTAPTCVRECKLNSLWAETVCMDQGLPHDLTVERDCMQTIYDILKVKNTITNWYYGHFHETDIKIIDGTKFFLINMNEIVLHED